MDRRLRIIVADDERDMREYLEEFVSYLGHEVRSVSTGPQIIAACRDFEPDLIITDFAMPGMSGFQAAMEVNVARRVSVVLISGRHDVEIPALAEGSPVVRFLAKPVRDADLREAIEAAVRETAGHAL